MQTDSNPSFLTGVIEGFYGRPWNDCERRTLFDRMQQWSLNTYLHAPKDDLQHRLRWRELYDAGQAAGLEATIREAQHRGLSFVYALGPGADLRYADPAELQRIRARFEQLMELGCRDFALLFDDIPGQLPEPDSRRFSSFAEAQCHVANEAYNFVRAKAGEARFFFCPTVYCGRMAKPSVLDSSYLRMVGERLHPEIDFLWTGPEIVSETITIESIQELHSVIRRPPVIWDNLHANDYDRRRVHLGPYSGRSVDLRYEVRGLLTNPNCEFAANFVPIRTLALFSQARESWTPRAAFVQALAEWQPAFAVGGESTVSVADLELLGDCFYLPHSLGERAQGFVHDFQVLLDDLPQHWGSAFERFEKSCEEIAGLLPKLAAIENRDLLHALYGPLWELREEASLLRSYARWLRSGPKRGETFASPEHLPHTYRGGLVAVLQHLLPVDEAGRFRHQSNQTH